MGSIAFLPSFLTACGADPKPKNASVLIIGAGMSGLAAARKLKQKGFTEITVLEARDRIGGRIFTDRSSGKPVDLGASWIHGTGNALQKNPIALLAEEASATTFETDDDSLKVFDTDGSPIDDALMDSYYADYQQLLFDKVPGVATVEKSLLQAIGEVQPAALNDPKMLYQLAAYTEFDVGGDLADMSSKFWDYDDAFPGKEVLFPNGYDALIQHLATDIKIELNTVVKSVDYGGEEIVVETSKGNFSAKHLIVTLPLGVLKAGSVSFKPALPATHQSAMDKLKTGTVNKIALEFPSQFWGGEQYLGYCSPVDKQGMYNYFVNCNTFKPGSNLLMTFGFGVYGLLLESQTNAQIQQDIMSILRSMYGNGIPNPTQILVSRWTQDPYTKGCYSFASVNSQPSDFDALGKEIQDKLFFAGEHTISQYRGTVHGAFLSGEREAQKLIDLY